MDKAASADLLYSSQMYEVAHLIAKNCTLETSAAVNSLRVLRRTLELTRSALASDVCSTIVQRRGDVSGSVAPAMQSLRAWSRALHNLHRIHSKPANVSDSIDPFYPVNRDKKDPLPDHLHEKRRMPSAAGPTAALSWYLAEVGFRPTNAEYLSNHAFFRQQRMAMSYIRVAHLYLLRGTPKSAEHYALQAIEFAAEIGFTRISARAYAVRAEIRMISSRFEDAQGDLQNMRISIGDVSDLLTLGVYDADLCLTAFS
jgi:separase